MLTRILGGFVASVAVAAPAAGQELLADPVTFEQSRGVTLFVDDRPISSVTAGDSGDGVGGGGGGTTTRSSIAGYQVSRSYSLNINFFISGVFPTFHKDNRVQLTSRAIIKMDPISEPAGKVSGIATTDHFSWFDVSEPVDYRLFGTITVDASATNGASSEAHAAVSLRQFGSFEPLFLFDERFTESAVIPIDVTGMLEGGDTSVFFETSSFAFGLADNSEAELTSDVRIDMTMELFEIPAPGALPAFACAGLLAVRRRRAAV